MVKSSLDKFITQSSTDGGGREGGEGGSLGHGAITSSNTTDDDERRHTVVVIGKDQMDEYQQEAYSGGPKRLERIFLPGKHAVEKVREQHKEEKETTGSVYLPILIIPGIASSGLYVEESSLDNKLYKGERVWMNAAFLAKSRFHNKTILNEEELAVAKKRKEDEKLHLEQQIAVEEGQGEVTVHGDYVEVKKPVAGRLESSGTTIEVSGGGGLLSNWKKKGQDAVAATKEKVGHTVEVYGEKAMNVGGTAANFILEKQTLRPDIDITFDEDYANGQKRPSTTLGELRHKLENDLAVTEDELAVKNAWIQHIALSGNMIDERPGNKIRAYDGMKGCEWLVDEAIAKSQGWVWAPMIKYVVDILGYEREKNIDAAPYDWRLAPSMTEIRDGYLTKTMNRVEKMYDDNNKLPIILCCHSMGSKMGHYFLNFALKKKGQMWLDKYIHTYMPVGAPHGGVALSIRTGATGLGLDDMIDGLIGNRSDGLTMYRSWSSGNWLMPRILPPKVFPPVIVRKEGELGLTVTSKFDVGLLFANRDKPPKSLRLTVQFRHSISTSTDFEPVIVSEDGQTMTVSFHETFFLAVPYLGENDEDNEIGELVFYLEEPGGRVTQNKAEIGKKFSKATGFMRGIKKKASKFAREVANNWGMTLRVACNAISIVLRASDFVSDNLIQSQKGGTYSIVTDVAMIGMEGGSRKNQKYVAFAKSDRTLADMNAAKVMAKTSDWGAYLRRYPDLKDAFGDDIRLARKHFFEYGYMEGRDPSPDEAGAIAANADLLPSDAAIAAQIADWSAYLARYEDLRKAFGKDTKKAKNHWFQYGFKEGRNCGPLEEGEDGYNADKKTKQRWFQFKESRTCDSSEEDDEEDNAHDLLTMASELIGSEIGNLSLKLSYSAPPKPSAPSETTSTPIAIINEETLKPHIVNADEKSNDRIQYDVWSGTDLFKNDGFVDPMFDMVEEYYENDPIGPITRSALDAPPVNCVRSIYGINVPTEVGAIYKKVPVVTVGDNEADSRYQVDKSATLDNVSEGNDLSSYGYNDGIVTETPSTLQNIPGEDEPRRVCGDGTVPYWNMIHALTWKDEVDVLTIDELEGAVHRGVIADERFFALLKRYCRVIDPRANAMLMMKSKRSGGISELGKMTLNSDSTIPD